MSLCKDGSLAKGPVLVEGGLPTKSYEGACLHKKTVELLFTVGPKIHEGLNILSMAAAMFHILSKTV
eukprot:241312-Amphidinium_carterae.1